MIKHYNIIVRRY